jgi:hypothetical protein
VVEPLERLVVVAAVALVGDGDVFVGGKVVQRERAGVAVGFRGFKTAAAEQDNQDSRPGA